MELITAMFIGVIVMVLFMALAQIAEDKEYRKMAKHDGIEYNEYSNRHYYDYKSKLRQYGNADKYINR